MIEKLQKLRTRRTEKGFTLVELLVVVAIIGILATLAIITLSGSTTSSEQTVAKGNLRSAAAVIKTEQATGTNPFAGTTTTVTALLNGAGIATGVATTTSNQLLVNSVSTSSIVVDSNKVSGCSMTVLNTGAVTYTSQCG